MKIAVVGAGLVGLASAHALADEGHAVTVLDREGPAAGASRGNAGWLAHTDIDPIASPKMLRQVPRFLMDPLGPLAIRPSYLLPIMPWLVRLVLAARPAQLERSVESLAALQALAMPAWEQLAGQLGIKDFIHRRGGLFVFESARDFAAARPHFDKQRAFGIACDDLGEDELRQMEPGLADTVKAAAYFPDAAHVRDPRLLTEALFEAALGRGVLFRQAAVEAVEGGDRPAIRLAEGSAEAWDGVVVAAGAWSKPLAAGLGDSVPLETERGYNVSFPGVSRLLRPVSFQGHGFVATPMETGLRIGGAVELAGLKLPPNHERSRALHAKARRFIRDLPAYDTGTQWMGFRPSLPDSLPVIDRSRASAKVVYAFGHGHYGLTQSAATARIVADLMAGREPPVDLARFSARRF
ncbi:MAG: FAD-dependent oxidoreductase [Alsobacter sp.]